MRCVICHSDIVPPKILAMCIRCMKNLIAYHKFNGIITMKKHVESHHFSLLKKLLEDGANFAIRFNCLLTTYIIDLWMSNGVHDVFVVMVNFNSNDWEM
jgi:hypothetical protein